MCAFTACVRFLRRRGPAGLRELFFGYSVVIFALPCSLPQIRSNGVTQCSLKFAQKWRRILLCHACTCWPLISIDLCRGALAMPVTLPSA